MKFRILEKLWVDLRNKTALVAIMFSFISTGMTSVFAAEQVETVFAEGSVLVICEHAKGKKLSPEAFEAAFPKWIPMLQTKADGGIVTRAHYLGKLKEGIFIVVSGPDKNAAMKNAVSISGEINTVYSEAAGIQGVDICEFREIGPVAVLPR